MEMEEDVKQVVKQGAIQRNFNSVMLTIAVGLMGYVAKTVASIDKTTALNVQSIQTNANSISKLQEAQIDQGKIIGTMDIRLTRVEATQDFQKQKSSQ